MSTGTTIAFFDKDENSPLLMQDLKIIFEGLRNELPQILILQILILSWPCDLFGLKFWIIFKIPSWESLINVRDQCARGAKLVGSVLLFSIIENVYKIYKNIYKTFYNGPIPLRASF